MINMEKVQILARILSANDPATYVKGVVVLRTPGSGAVHHIREALAQENLVGKIVDMSTFNPEKKAYSTPDDQYAKKLFNYLFVHDDKVIIMYVNPKFTSILGSMSSHVLRCAVDQTENGTMMWQEPGEKPIQFQFNKPIIFIVNDVDDLSPDVQARCINVDLRV